MRYQITLTETIETTYEPVVVEADNEEEAYIKAKAKLHSSGLCVFDEVYTDLTYETEEL